MTVRVSKRPQSSPEFGNRKRAVVEFKCRPCILLTFLQEFKGCHFITEEENMKQKVGLSYILTDEKYSKDPSVCKTFLPDPPPSTQRTHSSPYISINPHKSPTWDLWESLTQNSISDIEFISDKHFGLSCNLTS